MCLSSALHSYCTIEKTVVVEGPVLSTLKTEVICLSTVCGVTLGVAGQAPPTLPPANVPNLVLERPPPGAGNRGPWLLP